MARTLQIGGGDTIDQAGLAQTEERAVDLNNMTFQEILFTGRYAIIGAIMFLVFLVAFVREAVHEFLTSRQPSTDGGRSLAMRPMYHDPVMGFVMTDGGEHVDDSVDEDHKSS